MTYEEWLQDGIDAKYISTPWCWVHDSPTLTDEENEIVEGADGDLDAICVFAVRLQPEV